MHAIVFIIIVLLLMTYTMTSLITMTTTTMSMIITAICISLITGSDKQWWQPDVRLKDHEEAPHSWDSTTRTYHERKENYVWIQNRLYCKVR